MKGSGGMKVQCLNSSSLKTRERIKKAFVTLIHSKKSLDNITVKELVKEADITRSTFYTHYDNLDEVAKEYILNYFDTIYNCLSQNEETYHLLLTANETLFFLEKLKAIASKKIEEGLKSYTQLSSLDLSVSFFMNGKWFEKLFP